MADETAGFTGRLFRLDGKRALITGGRGALAETIAVTLADLGCAIALASRHEADCAATAASVSERFGTRAIGLSCDITDEDSVERTVGARPAMTPGIPPLWLQGTGLQPAIRTGLRGAYGIAGA